MMLIFKRFLSKYISVKELHRQLSSLIILVLYILKWFLRLKSPLLIGRMSVSLTLQSPFCVNLVLPKVNCMCVEDSPSELLFMKISRLLKCL